MCVCIYMFVNEREREREREESKQSIQKMLGLTQCLPPNCPY